MRAAARSLSRMHACEDARWYTNAIPLVRHKCFDHMGRGFFFEGGRGGGGVGILYLVSNSGEIRGRKNKQPQSFILSTQEKKSLTTG